MNVVVTGGAGFIGANLCRALCSDPDVGRVVALDDLSTGHRSNLAAPRRVELVEGSILDPVLLDRLFADADAVVHLAARPSVPRSLADPMASHLTNATGTMEVLEAARRGGRPQVVVASSSSVYGANPALPKREDMATMPVSPYAASKLAAESAVLAYGRSFGLPVLAFRFFNVFGPLQDADHAYAAVVPAFVACALRGEPLPVHGDGGQTRDFTYVGSVASVLAETVTRRVTDLGAGQPGLRHQGLAPRAHRRPREGPRHGTSTAASPEPRAGDVRDSQADQTRMRAMFPDHRAGRARRRTAGHRRMVPRRSADPRSPPGPAGRRSSDDQLTGPGRGGRGHGRSRPGGPFGLAGVLVRLHPGPNALDRRGFAVIAKSADSTILHWVTDLGTPAALVVGDPGRRGGRRPARPVAGGGLCGRAPPGRGAGRVRVQAAGGPPLRGGPQLPLGQRGRHRRGDDRLGDRRPGSDPAHGRGRRRHAWSA